MLFGSDLLGLKKDSLEDLGRCALVCNHASVDSSIEASWLSIRELLGEQLKVILSPQHGLFSVVQDNMIESDHSIEPRTGLKVYSLYSETRIPTPEMLEGIDTIIIDLQNVGCRVYTYKYTMSNCLLAAKELSKKVLVLDRQNPIGGQFVEGRILADNRRSFVGQFPIPMRHGLTMGELALFFNKTIGAEVEVSMLKNYKPRSLWTENNFPWVYPSPNLPTFDSALVFPGIVLLEGTNISEGRGTALPFQLVGAPYIRDKYKYAERVKELVGELPGIFLRPISFQPTAQKWAGQECQGIHLQVVDASAVRGVYNLGLAVVRAAIEMGEGQFQWKKPPYEYEYEKSPISLIVGHEDAEKNFESSDFSVEDPFWSYGVKSYLELVSEGLLYDRVLVHV